MRRVEIATLYEFSFKIHDNSRDAREWRKRVTGISFMEHWKDWLGDSTVFASDLARKFANNSVIVAYQPRKLPDWNNSIIGLMFYNKDDDFGYSTKLTSDYTINFMERRVDFSIRDNDYSYEFIPRLERIFLGFFDREIYRPGDTIRIVESGVSNTMYIQDRINTVNTINTLNTSL
tara:strand:- start:22 stop:549 length:528 start_codon:yes stop_codon:yes gene_type:complete